MAFVPIIDFCIELNEDDIYELIVTDITDVYDDPDNLTGWEDASTLLGSEVTAASITVEYEDENNISTTTVYDILNEIPSTVTGEIEFDPITYSGDGYYKITYTLTAGSTTYTACKVKMPYPNLACCISKKVLKLATEGCNCKNGKDLYDVVNELKALEKAYLESIKTVDKSSALKLYALLDDLCSNKTDCNCK